MANDDHDAIVKHIVCIGRLYTEQVEQAGGWPAKFTFPEPANDDERKALRMFIEATEGATGMTVRVKP